MLQKWSMDANTAKPAHYVRYGQVSVMENLII